MDTDKIVDMLNNAFKNDPKLIEELFNCYAKCNNESLVENPYLICGSDKDGNDGLSVLGVINGIMNAFELDRVASLHSDDGKLKGFEKYINKEI